MSYAIITGGSKGIGKEIAIQLALKKYDLLLIARSTEELHATKREIEDGYGVKVDFLAVDLSVPGASTQISKFIEDKSYNISVLVNNAGYGLWGFFEKLSLEAQKEMMQVNMCALVELTYLLLPFLKKNNKAYILNVASTAAYQAVPALSVYAASKSFVLLFTRGLRFELKNSNVSATCMSPGATSTNFTNRAGMQAMQAVADKFSMPAHIVAKAGVNALFSGKAEIIPGFVNIFSVQMINFLPKSLIETIAANLYLKYLK